MEWIGWALAAIAIVCVAVLVGRNRTSTARTSAERAEWERNARAELESAQGSAAAAAKSLRADAERVLSQAEEHAAQEREDLTRRRHELEASVAAQRVELRDDRAALERREARLHEREDRLGVDLAGLEARSQRVESRRAEARELEAKALELRNEAAMQVELSVHELERVAGLSIEDAKTEVLAEAERHSRLAAAQLARDIESAARRDAERKARSVVVTAIQRVASDQTTESVMSSVFLPRDDMKGRIIGREGRNIRVFEQITGVNILIDDTPDSVLLSSFDPVRREIARLTLTELVADGRIHPARIEEVYHRSERRIAERIERAADDALVEVGITDLDPDLIPILGSLAYRTSYGQNVLRHLVETAHLAGVMAAELGLDVAVCKRAAFLHDIGKALTHEVEGPHALIGAELLRKHGEHEDVVHAVEAHHNEVEPRTVEAVLTQAADAISGSRPGARRESLEAYVERMEKLEGIATAHPGVQRAFAMQAGREVRIMVNPELMDDLGAQALARDVAQEIEAKLSYPGQIRITVVRESRATQTAH